MRGECECESEVRGKGRVANQTIAWRGSHELDCFVRSFVRSFTPSCRLIELADFTYLLGSLSSHLIPSHDISMSMSM